MLEWEPVWTLSLLALFWSQPCYNAVLWNMALHACTHLYFCFLTLTHIYACTHTHSETLIHTLSKCKQAERIVFIPVLAAQDPSEGFWYAAQSEPQTCSTRRRPSHTHFMNHTWSHWSLQDSWKRRLSTLTSVSMTFEGIVIWIKGESTVPWDMIVPDLEESYKQTPTAKRETVITVQLY